MDDSRSTLPPNTILVDGFRIERYIGAGGFGITYLGEDLHLGTTVAIKEYYPDEFGDRDASLSVRPKTDRHRQTFEWGRTSFLQEARMLARFRHHSIVRITRVFEANATAYMVMEFEEGRSLEAWLKTLERPPTQAELDRIVAPLLDALELMHADSFLHRDIAPDNIIIRPNGTPVLLDFGAARRAMAEQSRVLTGIIKAGYSPQEQYATDGRLQGPWSDLYALGATLYRAITGKPPEEATLRAGDDQTPPAAKAAQGEYRPAFLVAVDACLNVDRRKRPQSVAELRAMLAGEAPTPESTAARLERALSYMGKDRRALWLPWWLGWLDVAKGKRLRSALVVALAFLLVMGGYSSLEYIGRLADERARVRAEAEAQRKAEAEKKRIEEQKKLELEEARRRRERRERQPVLRFGEEKKDAEEAARRREEQKRAEEKRSSDEAKRHTLCDGGIMATVANERRCLKAKDIFKDCSECPEMVVVPAGSFTMGSLVGEEGRENHEGPQRTVTIGKAFAAGKFEVTFAEWDECVAAGDCKYGPADQGWGRGRRPVINVSWDDITREYLPWLSRKAGKPYTLLTEAQWEYTARAGTTTPFSTGQTIASHEANFTGGFTSDARAKGAFRNKTTEAGSFRANTFGLHDMHGNLWEWVQDCWKDNYADSPTDGSVWTTQECRLRVLRGGSWNFYQEHLRSAARLKARQDIRFNFFGFRVARTLD